VNHTREVLKSRLNLGNIGLLVLVAVMAVQTVFYSVYREVGRYMITNSRSFRDAMGVTPFHSVIIYRTEVTPAGLMIWGELIKSACHRVDLYAFTRDAKGRLQYAIFESKEPGGGPKNRVIMPDPQRFGPWLITPNEDARDADPAAALVAVSHECPDPFDTAKTITVTNTVLQVPWATTLTPQRQEFTFNVPAP